MPQSLPPTPVLHVRQLPFGATPHDIAEFMSQFGPVDFASHLPNRGQALVEFRDTASAVRAIEAGQQRPLVLGDRTMFVNFSRSKQINRAVAVSMAPQGDPSAGPGQPGAAFDASGGRASLAPRPDIMDDRPLPAPATFVSPVLCLHVNKATAPIDVDTVLRVCESAELRPLRVVIFYKHGVQALVEMDSPATALALAERVHNQFIYEDCCKIVAAPSRTGSNLNVTVQNDLTRDLTRSDLPAGPPSNPRTLSPAQMADREKAIEAGGPPPPMPWDGPAAPGGLPGGVRPPPPHAAAAAGAMVAGAGAGGGGYRDSTGHEGGATRGPAPGAYPHVHGGTPAGPPPHHGAAPPPPHHGGGGYGAPPPPPPGPPAGRGSHSGASATSAYVPGGGGRGSIVRVLGLDPARATARRVFNVVCSYGNVRRILCRPPGSDPADGGAASALVEFEDATQAGGAASFLNGHVLFDRKLSLSVAEADRIDGAPLPGEESDPLGVPHVRDWVGSPHNRFRRVEQFRNVFKPTSTLHVSNIPPAYQQDHLEAVIIGQGGARPSRVAWMDPPGGRFTVGAPRRVALVQFATDSEALESMMMANNVFQDGHTIKFAPTNKTPR